VPREILYQRIDARIEKMIKVGFLDEVRTLLNHGYSPDLPALSAIGYPEMIACIQGRMTLDEAVSEIKRKTRIFVRRQANWFKAQDPEIHWLEDNDQVLGNALAEMEKPSAWILPDEEGKK
jgi:tRNA dimethylallyltransferase